jgi:type II secretory pathway component GspD/PulD (secretin)
MKLWFNQHNSRQLACRLSMIAASGLLISTIAIAQPGAAFAQDSSALPTQSVSVSLSNAPVREALDALFKSAGLNYTIDPSITQSVTVNLHNIPFDVALRSILRSTNPPLQYTVKDGIYQISQPDLSQQSVAPPAQPTPGAAQPQFNTPNSMGYSASGSDSREAVVLYLTYINGTLLNKLVGPIIEIPPALTLSNYSGTTGGAGGGVTGGTTGGFGGGGAGGFGGGGGGFGGAGAGGGYGGSIGGAVL